ncbi:hypothetical protein T265_12808 [Opisthorchis viverrini]|uniref:Uncharacterized protein n=1 Tax=Opisthorchis viverrini TaxID=6198 RepID=A0A075AIZ1_OPIVI|nr:hypothetical protein T265_12808 [Opisthorchis viverrini]KER32474.1 hypothetical protein T265_12808 [Opisthorchis viverrini]
MVSITEEPDSERTDIYTPRSILKDSETETEYQIRTRFFMNPQTAKLPTRVYRRSFRRQFSEPRYRLSQLRQLERSNLLKCKGEDVGTQFYLEDIKSESAVHEQRRGSVESAAFLGVREQNTASLLEGRLIAELQSAIGHYTMLSTSLSELDKTEFNVRLQSPSAAGESQAWTSGDAFRPATSDRGELTKIIKAKKPLRTNRRQPLSLRKQANSEYGQISMMRLNTNPSSHDPGKPNVQGSCAQPKPDRSRKTCNYRQGRSPLFNFVPIETGVRRPQKTNKRLETQLVPPLGRRTREERVIRRLHHLSADDLSEQSSKETNRFAKPTRVNFRKNSDSARKTISLKTSKPQSAPKVAYRIGQHRRSKSSAT